MIIAEISFIWAVFSLGDVGIILDDVELLGAVTNIFVLVVARDLDNIDVVFFST